MGAHERVRLMAWSLNAESLSTFTKIPTLHDAQ